jgi:hypothetical protein
MEQSEILYHSVGILSVSRNGKSSDFLSEPIRKREKTLRTWNFVPNHTVDDKKL